MQQELLHDDTAAAGGGSAGSEGMLRRAARKATQHGLLLPVLALLLPVFAWPLLHVLRLSVQGENWWSHYSTIADPLLVRVVLRTLRISFLVTIVSLAVALPYAHIAARVASRRVGRLMMVGALGSLFLSIVVRGYAWLAIMGRGGVLQYIGDALGFTDVYLVPSVTGIVIGMSHFAIPLMLMPIYSAIVRYDTRLDRAAASLGARPRQTALRVYLPVITPGIGAGCATVFTVTLGYYVLPAILGGPSNQMVGTMLALRVQRTLEFGEASAMAVLLLGVSLISFLLVFRATRREFHA